MVSRIYTSSNAFPSGWLFSGSVLRHCSITPSRTSISIYLETMISIRDNSRKIRVSFHLFFHFVFFTSKFPVSEQKPSSYPKHLAHRIFLTLTTLEINGSFFTEAIYHVWTRPRKTRHTIEVHLFDSSCYMNHCPAVAKNQTISVENLIREKSLYPINIALKVSLNDL